MTNEYHALKRYRGTAAERASFDTDPLAIGTKFLESDTGDEYAWNGTSWVQSDVVTQLGDADGGNYSEFEADGTLEFNGDATVWDDIFFPMSSGRIGGANQPTWAAFQGNTFEYTFAINDYIHLPSGEIVHKYLEGSDIEIHCHIVLDGSDVGDTYVNYEVEYTLGDMGEVMSAAATITSGDTLIPGGTADRTHLYIEIDDITGTGYQIGAALKMRFRRLTLVGGGLDDPSNDPFVMMVGVHIEMDTVGSRTETAK